MLAERAQGDPERLAHASTPGALLSGGQDACGLGGNGNGHYAGSRIGQRRRQSAGIRLRFRIGQRRADD
jgi:hypothetical protein